MVEAAVADVADVDAAALSGIAQTGSPIPSRRHQTVAIATWHLRAVALTRFYLMLANGGGVRKKKLQMGKGKGYGDEDGMSVKATRRQNGNVLYTYFVLQLPDMALLWSPSAMCTRNFTVSVGSAAAPADGPLSVTYELFDATASASASSLTCWSLC